MHIENILLDSDGVLADFLKSALEILNKKYDKDITVSEYAKNIKKWSVHEAYNISEEKFWQHIGEDLYFWSRLQPFEWARMLYDVCGAIAPVTIATSPNKDPRCLEQKAIWFRRIFGIPANHIMFGKRKTLMARKGTVLIDDNPDNVEKFVTNGGSGIVLPSNWNTPEINPTMVMAALMRGMEGVLVNNVPFMYCGLA